jgi:hypothetical protein
MRFWFFEMVQYDGKEFKVVCGSKKLALVIFIDKGYI